HTGFDCDWSSDVCSSDLDTVTATSGAARAQTLVTILAPAPPPPVAGPVGCGVRIPPPVGCGMPEGTWALLGVDTVSRGYGPWFEIGRASCRERGGSTVGG